MPPSFVFGVQHILQQSNRVLFVILAVALLLRVVAAFAVEHHVAAQGRRFLIEGDANGYWELAGKIAAGEDYAIHFPPRHVHRTPGFPFLLAPVILVCGDSVLAARLLLALVGTGCCWLTYRLARRLLDELTALVAAGIMAVSPLQVGNSVLILSETWFAFWLLLSLLALLRIPAYWSTEPRDLSNRFRNLTSAAIAGIATGLTVLVRPGWILWPGFSGLLLLTFGIGKMSSRITLAVLISAMCLATLVPWARRNHQVSGHWVFTSLWSGPSLYDGLHPGATGASDMRFVDEETVFATKSEYDANAEYKQRAWDFAVANPGRSVSLALAKAGRYLSLTPNAQGFSGGALSLICLGFYSSFFGLVVSGILVLRDRPAIIAILTAPFLQFLLVHMVFVGSVRYRLPVEFPLAVLAATAVMWLFRRWNFRGLHGLPGTSDAVKSN